MMKYSKMKKHIYRQAALVAVTVILTVAVWFAMTSAWYSNVVQTSGLTFEAQSFGFEGDITVGNEVIKAAPGEDDIIDLTVKNDSDSVSAISVNISKNTMSEEMQRRLFFYVDTRVSRNNETMERVYLNRYEGYTYNVFNNSQLILTKEYSNAPVIKWEWVYDVLGYYVTGKPYEVSDIKKMDIEEYLRPIIYDFDEATTLINTEGESITVELETVDGVRTPVEFLAELSQNDGYEGSIAEDAVPDFDNYYRVDVDEEGYGVYAYLCNYSEIQIANAYDTKLGALAYSEANGELREEEAAELQHKAVLTLSAQKDDDTVVVVSTPGALQDTIDLGVADVIQLSSDITLAEGSAIVIPENRRIMLDLNGHTLTNGDGTAITAESGSQLTLTNGTLKQAAQSGSDAATYGVRSVGAEVVMSNMVIDDFGYGVYVGDNADGNELDSRVYIVDSSITADTCAAFVSGNGLMSGQLSRLIIERSVLSSYGIGVSGNGNTGDNGRWGTDIQIIESTIQGIEDPETGTYGIGIYQPQKNSMLTVRSSTVEGYNGITLKGGSAVIDSSTIIGKGTYQQPSFEGSGSTDTGDAVYIETNYGYDISLLVCGSSVLEHDEEQKNQAGEGCRSLRVYEENASNVAVEIESGIFEETQPAAYLAEGSTQAEITDEQGNILGYRVTEAEQSGDITGDQSNETT